MRSSKTPTILIFGHPHERWDANYLFSQSNSFGIILDNGKGRDPVFSFSESLARADAIIALPNAHPLHLVSLLAEAEVGHPYLSEGNRVRSDRPLYIPKTKPIIFLGTQNEWLPFFSIFHQMKAEGLIRNGLEDHIFCTTRIESAIERVMDELPGELPKSRLSFYHHSQKSADLETIQQSQNSIPSNTTISFFGSASTTNECHILRAELLAQYCAQNSWNVLHGGGNAGVMGALTRAGKKHGAYIYGVSVDFSGAPKIFFERERSAPDVDYFIASKDMIHRIETYAGISDAFISLDGGVGSLQEILMIAELLHQSHPAVTYEKKNGQFHHKPLFLSNSSGLFDNFLFFLKCSEHSHLQERIQVCLSTEDLKESLSDHFVSEPPLPISLSSKLAFRRRYPNDPVIVT